MAPRLLIGPEARPGLGTMEPVRRRWLHACDIYNPVLDGAPSIDSAVASPVYEMFKFVSVPCAGAAFAVSFPLTHPLLTGVLKANVVSMLAVFAWVYTVAPVRLCNSYLASDQKMLGTGMAILVSVLAIRWGVGLLFGGNTVRFHPGHHQAGRILHAADRDFNSVGVFHSRM
jgi:hypothetical protein